MAEAVSGPSSDTTGSRGDGSTHRLDIQALRGVAVLLVVLYHADLGFSGGFVGVDAFFVISGYVIAATLGRELDQSGTISLRRFYARRIRRLMPALALVSVTVLAVSIVVLPFSVQPVAAGTALAATFFAANAYLYRVGGGYFSPAAEANPFLHTWSLSIEEQFYLVLPSAMMLLWVVAGRLGVHSRRRLTGAVFAVVALVSFWWSWQTTNGRGLFAAGFESPERFAFYAPVTRVWEFLIGVLLAFAAAALPIGRRTARVMRGVGLAALLYAASTFDELTLFPGAAAAVPVFATALVIAAGSTSLATESLPLALPGWQSAQNWLVWIGDISYSWYLWHWPAITLTAAVSPGNQTAAAIAAFASLLPAWMSKRWVEDPIRFRLPPGRASLTFVAALCLLAPTAVALAGRIGASTNWGVAVPVGWADQRLAGRMGCVDTSETTWPADRCTITSADSNGLVLLLGDSHASSASDGVADAADRLGMDFAVWAKSGCPFLLNRATHNHPTCPGWQDAAIKVIDLHNPDVVVIANRSSGYTSAPGKLAWGTIATANGQRPETQIEKLTSWEEGLDGLLSYLHMSSAEPKVVLVANVPEYPPYKSEFPVSLLQRSPPLPTIDRVDVNQRRAFLEIEADVVASFPRVELLDPADILCEPAICRAGEGNTWWYMDTHHLNPDGSLLLADSLADTMRSLLLD